MGEGKQSQEENHPDYVKNKLPARADRKLWKIILVWFCRADWVPPVLPGAPPGGRRTRWSGPLRREHPEEQAARVQRAEFPQPGALAPQLGIPQPGQLIPKIDREERVHNNQ